MGDRHGEASKNCNKADQNETNEVSEETKAKWRAYGADLARSYESRILGIICGDLDSGGEPDSRERIRADTKAARSKLARRTEIPSHVLTTFAVWVAVLNTDSDADGRIVMMGDESLAGIAADIKRLYVFMVDAEVPTLVLSNPDVVGWVRVMEQADGESPRCVAIRITRHPLGDRTWLFPSGLMVVTSSRCQYEQVFTA